jgi:hypothetical protein
MWKKFPNFWYSGEVINHTFILSKGHTITDYTIAVTRPVAAPASDLALSKFANVLRKCDMRKMLSGQRYAFLEATRSELMVKPE